MSMNAQNKRKKEYTSQLCPKQSFFIDFEQL